MEVWRLILDGPAEGAWNMAVDRAVLDAHAAGAAPPTLRLYSWATPTVSLGRFQPVADVDSVACAAYGIDVCRRPTGGRGVLHDDEVTYSIVAGTRDGLPRGTAASYRALCAALVEAYRRIGIEAELTPRTRGAGGTGACYLHATPADLSLGAAKLSGSAQVWAKDSCLQHGSFVVSRDVEREARVFGLDGSAEAALAATTDTIEHALGKRPRAGALSDAIVSGIADALGVRFEHTALDDDEVERARDSVEQFRVQTP